MLDLMAQAGLPGLDQMTLEQARAGMSMTDPERRARGGARDPRPRRRRHPRPARTTRATDVTGLLVYFHGGRLGDRRSRHSTTAPVARWPTTPATRCCRSSTGWRPSTSTRRPSTTARRRRSWAYDNAASAARPDPERLAVGGDSAGGNLAAMHRHRRNRALEVRAARVPGHRPPRCGHASQHRERGGLLLDRRRRWSGSPPTTSATRSARSRIRRCPRCSPATTCYGPRRRRSSSPLVRPASGRG